jgi:hypothetical protein
MTRHNAKMLTLVSLLSIVALSAEAALQRVGPVNPATGYPSWYQDGSGLALEFCSPTNAAELNGGWCLLLPPVPSATPETYPPPANNPDAFSPEHFFWDAAAGGRHTGLLFEMALEGAFLSGPVIPGEQITFGRLRLVIPSLPVSGDYVVYHPFGVWPFNGQVAGDRLFYTEDVGFNCPPSQFDCALGTSIGPFLLPSPTPGGVQLHPIPLLLPGEDPFYDALVAAGAATPYPGIGGSPKYLADPARIGPITGSPLPPFLSPADGLLYDHNRFRIEVTDAATGVTTVIHDEINFSIAGRIFEGSIPGAVTVNRASYVTPVWASSTAAKLDVFATGTPGMQARIPPAPAATLLSAVPSLVFWDAPCTLDAVTLLPIGPPPAGASHAMTNAGSNYWGQSPPPIAPPSVCVAQTNAPAAGGGTAAVYYAKNVVDEVTVSTGSYDPTATSLTVNAASSDLIIVPPATLNLVDFGALTAGAFGSNGLPAPATLRVESSLGGVADFQTNTGLSAGPPATPVAANDMTPIFEDCSPVGAVACITPQVITPLVNDTLGGAPIVFGPGVTLTLRALPRLGRASYVDSVTLAQVACAATPCPINSADGSLLYTPNSNANGTDGFAYTVSTTTLAGVVQTSNVAGISVVIAPVNDPPAAANDTMAAVVNVATNVNVLANDTDPDGAADLVGIANLTQPVGPAGAIASAAVAGTAVTFTANTGGIYTFTYQAQDTAAALSNVATVTVTVAAAETLTITPPATFIAAQKRWKIAGVSTPAVVGKQVKIQYYNGVNGSATAGAGFLVGTATVADTLGNWTYDFKPVSGLADPTIAGATQVMAYTATGGKSFPTAIQLK